MKNEGSVPRNIGDLIDRLEIVQSELHKIQEALEKVEPRASAKAHDPGLTKAPTLKRPSVGFGRHAAS
jgi:hypothetical protein